MYPNQILKGYCLWMNINNIVQLISLCFHYSCNLTVKGPQKMIIGRVASSLPIRLILSKNYRTLHFQFRKLARYYWSKDPPPSAPPYPRSNLCNLIQFRTDLCAGEIYIRFKRIQQCQQARKDICSYSINYFLPIQFSFQSMIQTFIFDYFFSHQLFLYTRLKIQVQWNVDVEKVWGKL